MNKYLKETNEIKLKDTKKRIIFNITMYSY